MKGFVRSTCWPCDGAAPLLYLQNRRPLDSISFLPPGCTTKTLLWFRTIPSCMNILLTPATMFLADLTEKI
ncbi:hypothetical protein BDV26DRAFT_252853 [Aspergillus bertholletiae]|uniref:Uncharacterized protein n=1 Tax=Aspergillus bertholletiae TaxID=1226010 RepID=A0A5N7BM87_9EURO|nr:hypothetical protein BDV26DRAFT_252853 [Aspergillus bertholletiae]